MTPRYEFVSSGYEITNAQSARINVSFSSSNIKTPILIGVSPLSSPTFPFFPLSFLCSPFFTSHTWCLLIFMHFQ
ncbi:hypothetical protein K501DRAFT_75875 [Backusella circina FSU 941]|nr:hypothetical protein K501DRAFT_75875 [Backusella circina FSU 941]